MMLQDRPHIQELRMNPAIQSLTGLDQWAVYVYPDKIPLNPVTGFRAATDKPHTWGTFVQAKREVEREDSPYHGLGFILRKSTGLTGIDLDKCIDEHGQIKDGAIRIVERINSYTEKTPSGRGLRIWVQGNIPLAVATRKPEPDGIEMYDHERFFTITGEHLEGTPDSIEYRQEEVLALYEEVMASRQKYEKASPVLRTDTLALDSPYGLKALAEECRTLAHCAEGARNNTLNEAAFKVGSLVASLDESIRLSYNTAYSQLLAASIACGLWHEEQKQTENTLARALADGMSSPRPALTIRIIERPTPEEGGSTPEQEREQEVSSVPPLPASAHLSHVPLAEVSRWMNEYITYSRRISPEGYEDFHLGCGVWVLSTVAARRIYVPLADPIYTSLAIALVARTSLFAKTTTAKGGLRVLKAAGLDFLLGDDETTPQKLLADMAGFVPANYSELDVAQQEQIRKRTALSGQLGWYYDEFNQLINAMTRQGPMAEFAGLLRKLDGCPDEYKYSTRTHGQAVISKPYLALLANTNPANLSRFAGRGGEFWHDGFWARFGFITPPAKAWKTATMDVGEVPIPYYLSERLRKWNEQLGVPHCSIQIEGETGRYHVDREPLQDVALRIDEEAYQAYNRYRIALRELIANQPTQDLDGSYVRLSDKAMRIAALLASLEHNNRISLQVWTVAQDIAEMFRSNLHELYAQINMGAEEQPMEDLLITYLKSLGGKPITVREIVQYAPLDLRRLKSDGIRDLLLSLERSGIVASHHEGRKEWYTLVPLSKQSVAM